MCGIVGYLGKNDAHPNIIAGLKKLEYRGYDSSGLAVLNGSLNIYKMSGKVEDLCNYLQSQSLCGQIGIGHTRWATHGEPNDINAHPHTTRRKDLALIHNGIIENYKELKEKLEAKGHSFDSETDSEVIVHLIEDIQDTYSCSLEKAVQMVSKKLEGAFAIIVISQQEPGKLVAAKRNSPLVIGVDDGEFFLASDKLAFPRRFKKAIFMEDNDIVTCKQNGDLILSDWTGKLKAPIIQELGDHIINDYEKGEYEHFMLKEIEEQPQVIKNCLQGRIDVNYLEPKLRGIYENEVKFLQASKMTIVACGTSWHAGIVGKYLIEKLAKLNVEVDYASEFRYRDPIINSSDIVVAISQSGETADTLAALKMAKEAGAFTYGVCNVEGSAISRMTDAGSYTCAGAEIGVASTKAFISQICVLGVMAIQLGLLKRKITREEAREYLQEISQLPGLIEKTLKSKGDIQKIAQKYFSASDFLYLGRGVNFPIALEGALKLKEISYIHAEGYAAAEMKHGPIALIDENMPVVVVANQESYKDKIFSSVKETKARKGKIISIVKESDTLISSESDDVIKVPNCSDFLAPFISVIPLQILSYYIALLRGCNVDQPRNLAKSVTVE